MSAPTREEIIAQIHGKMDEGGLRPGGDRDAARTNVGVAEPGLTDDLGHVVDDYAMWIRHPAWVVLESDDPRDFDPKEAETSLWWDLRASESTALMERMKAAQARLTAECEALIIEGLADAAEAFAREFPDAPRGGIRVAVPA